MASSIAQAVPLAPLTTLELGGAAEHFLELDRADDLGEALAWAAARGYPVTILGGGSNVVIADRGIDGLVVRMVTRGIDERVDGATLLVRAAAGEPWDDVVAHAVGRGASGIECLSGIPGSVGATPIQNVGAYGQEVADVITRVHVLDRRTRVTDWIGHHSCGFGYRDSTFKREPSRYVVLEVEYALRLGPPGPIRHAELARSIAPGDGALAEASVVRAHVLGLRRSKSMVLDPLDDNRRSVGSFFTNPVVTAAEAAAIARRADDGDAMPSWPLPDGRVKLAAAWLIERSGTARGERHGAVGVSSRHTLALVHHGGGTTRALLELAERVAARVRVRFGITLEREPVLLGQP